MPGMARSSFPFLITAAASVVAFGCAPPPPVPPPRFTPNPPGPPEQVVPEGETPPPPKPVPGDYPLATRTENPDRVISPFPPHHVIDVAGFSSGQLARDPSNQKIFRVP